MGIIRTILDTVDPTLGRGLGAVANPEDDRDIPAAAVAGAPDEASIPEAIRLDDSFVPIFDQRSNGSCVGQATGFELAYAIGPGGFELSRRMVYAFCKKVDGLSGEGTYPRLAYKIVTDDGAATARTAPNDDALPHERYIDVPRASAVLADAAPRKAPGYTFPDASARGIAAAVARKMPDGRYSAVGVSIAVDRKAFRAKKGNLTAPKKVEGWHRVAIVGYELLPGGDVRFTFRNSWGTSWGDKGYGTFRWSDYGDRYVRDPMAITAVPEWLRAVAHMEAYRFKAPDIVRGERGNRVLQLQLALQRRGLLPEGWDYVTGFYGDATARAVLAFQRREAVADEAVLAALAGGRVGPATMSALNNDQREAPKTLIEALIEVESNGDDNAVGDLNLANKAYGCLQIRKPYVDDVNRALGTAYRAEDCLGNRELSIKIFNAYMGIYMTEKRLGRPVTDQDRARAHNGGGPNGWRSPATLGYWEKVKRALRS